MLLVVRLRRLSVVRRRSVLLLLLRVHLLLMVMRSSLASSSIFLLDLAILLLKLRLLDGHLGRATGRPSALLSLAGGLAETTTLLLRSRWRSCLLLLRVVGAASHLRNGDGNRSGCCWRRRDRFIDDGEVPEPAERRRRQQRRKRTR